MPTDKDSTTTEVQVPKKRRVYSDRYKIQILEQLDASSELGDKGSLLRSEGLYHSTVSRWRRQMAGASRVKRGRPKKSALEVENKDLKRQLEALQGRLDKAEIVIDIQKKLCSLLEPLSPPVSSESSR